MFIYHGLLLATANFLRVHPAPDSGWEGDPRLCVPPGYLMPPPNYAVNWATPTFDRLSVRQQGERCEAVRPGMKTGLRDRSKLLP